MAYPTPRRPGARKKEDKSTVTTAAVVLGWLLFAFLAFKFARTTSIRDDRIGRIRASQADLHNKHQEDVDAKKKAIHNRKMAAATTINEQNSAQAVVNSIVNKRLRPESEKLQTAVADLEQVVEKLTANVQTIAADLGTSGNELDRLKTRMRELGTEETKLKREYQQKYKEMKAVYREKLGKPDPAHIAQFYESHDYTPFAPAAAFFTAEQQYAINDSEFAVGYYKKILRHFPKSKYANYAMDRIEQIEKGQPYQENKVEFYPYNILPFIAHP